MPVYLCKPGHLAPEPWRHGLQVYAFPFDIDKQGSESQVPGESQSSFVQPSATWSENHERSRNASAFSRPANSTEPGAPPHICGIRRIRHSEVVLVDDVCQAYGNYWLKLRWPGKGGFAGYVALVSGMSPPPRETLDRGDIKTINAAHSLPLGGMASEAGTDTPIQFPPVGSFAANTDDRTLRCLRTGLPFPSSTAMQLLDSYDDGITPPVALPPPFEGNPVFCRICREGIHDVTDDEPSPETADDEGRPKAENTRNTVHEQPRHQSSTAPFSSAEPSSIGPILPHPIFSLNNAAAENPLLAPCECSGSMAFVHYLCLEQWRCRSRHPEAQNGLNCETCGKPYGLPPPSSRPVPTANVPFEEEWLEAMPPHVMAALRQPHIWWQLGAAIVRRRWLRPLAPVAVSPLVALYCRARRLLKKRGVSRRRWACSLCRRRARWKCVRCLRSYYCSRQCQNVSWHIVHKHVCYKPARFWWSVVVYGASVLLVVPGILKDPFMYDVALSLIPVSFYVMAILGGGFATVLKKLANVDLRGRMLELAVVLATAWLVWLSWGLIWAFFGETPHCVGVLEGLENEKILRAMNTLLLSPGRSWFLFWDKLVAASIFKSWLCTNVDGGCFSHLPQANPNHILEMGACRSDMTLMALLWIAAGATMILSALWKKRRRVNGVRPHQE